MAKTAKQKKSIGRAVIQAARSVVSTGVRVAILIVLCVFIGLTVWAAKKDASYNGMEVAETQDDTSQMAQAEAPQDEMPDPEVEEDKGIELPVRRQPDIELVEGDAERVTVTPARIRSITEQARVGPLPKISRDNLSAFRLFSAAYDERNPNPRIALIVRDMGLSEVKLEEVLAELPPQVTLAWSPYGKNLTQGMEAARELGFESVLMLAMEPSTYGYDDPGGQSLLVSLKIEDNIKRLEWQLSRGIGYAGVVTEAGSRFTAHGTALRPMLQQLRRRGLVVVDSNTAEDTAVQRIAGEIGLARSVNDLFVDDVASVAAIDKQLAKLEAIAMKEGTAIGIMHGYPLTMQRLREWLPQLESRDISLAPISATLNRQEEE